MVCGSSVGVRLLQQRPTSQSHPAEVQFQTVMDVLRTKRCIARGAHDAMLRSKHCPDLCAASEREPATALPDGR
jgi:hypothetical protein